MTSLHSTWQLILTVVVIISLAVSCFLGVHLYNLALVWGKLVAQRGSIDMSGQVVFDVLALFVYGFAGFVFLRQKLKL
jgi:hypothetical protein